MVSATADETAGWIRMAAELQAKRFAKRLHVKPNFHGTGILDCLWQIPWHVLAPAAVGLHIR